MEAFLLFLLLTDPTLAKQNLAHEQFRKEVATILPVNEANEIADALQDSCLEFGVEPKLMLALIYVESSGNPKAISKVGAIGLTQIMPATGEQIAEELGVPWTSREMLFDIKLNIRFGTYYMRKLLDRFDGEHIPAVASYNWGPTSIARRMRKGQAVPTGYASKVLRTRERALRL